jgi:uncharacterized protein DUF3617
MRRVPALLLIVASPLLFAADTFDVKPGLWQIETTTAMNGIMLPKEFLDRMTPDQRKRMADQMNALAAKGPIKHNSKQCVTAEDLKKGLFSTMQDSAEHCSFTPTVQTAKHQAGKMTCGASGTGEADFQAITAEQVRGTMTLSVSGGSTKIDIAGKWLATSCAGADED